MFQVLIAFSTYEIGSTVSEETLQSNDFSIIDLVNGGVIEPVKEEENKPSYPKYMVMNRDIESPDGGKGLCIARYIHEGNGLFRFESIVLPFEALNADSRFVPIADDEEFDSYLDKVADEYSSTLSSEDEDDDDDEPMFSLSDLIWMVEHNPENNHSPFANKLGEGFIAAAAMLNFFKTLTPQ